MCVGIGEAELKRLAKERQIILDTYDKKTGLFGFDINQHRYLCIACMHVLTDAVTHDRMESTEYYRLLQKKKEQERREELQNIRENNEEGTEYVQYYYNISITSLNKRIIIAAVDRRDHEREKQKEREKVLARIANEKNNKSHKKSYAKRGARIQSDPFAAVASNGLEAKRKQVLLYPMNICAANIQYCADFLSRLIAFMVQSTSVLKGNVFLEAVMARVRLAVPPMT
jgi:hypothetical protein